MDQSVQENEQVRKNKLKLDSVKIVDGFLFVESYVKKTKILLFFETKSWYSNRKEISKSQMVAQKN